MASTAPRANRAIALSAAILLALSGCGSSASPTEDATRSDAAHTSTPVTTPTPGPTPDMAALGDLYRTLATASNQEVCRFNKVWASSAATTEELRAASTAMADALRQFDEGLRRQTWPPPLDASVRDLIVAHGAVEAAFLSAASRTDYAGVVGEINRAIEANSAAAAAATVVRGDLGIEAGPGVPTDC